jgi:uncharacterized protein with HEPN domain
MQAEDRARLLDVLEAASDARSFVQGETRASLDRDKKLALALRKCIEIIGEAAANVSDEARALLPEIPWPKVVGMRHRLVHGYFAVDLNRIWDTVTLDLPPLIQAIEALSADSEEGCAGNGPPPRPPEVAPPSPVSADDLLATSAPTGPTALAPDATA